MPVILLMPPAKQGDDMQLGSISIREFSEVGPADGEIRVALLDVRFDSYTPGAIQARVRGVSNGATVVVTLGWERELVRVSTNPSTGVFEVVADLAPLPLLGDWLRIEAVVEAGTGSTAIDSVIVGLAKLTTSVAGVLASVSPERLGLLAGSSDRLVNKRYFRPLRPTRYKPSGRPTEFELSDGTAVTFDPRFFGDHIKKAVLALEQQLETGKLTDVEHALAVEAVLDTAIRDGVGIEKNAPENLQSRVGSAKDTAPAEDARALFGRLSTNAYMRSTKLKTFGGVHSVLGLIVKGQQAAKLGVLFEERLRFQPTGLLLGEEVAAISVAPGEQVEVRQTVETKRRAVLEDIRDREEERETTLSSAWSTEVTEGFSVRDDHSNRSSLDTNVGASIPVSEIVTIDAGVAQSSTIETAHGTSGELSVLGSVEQTRTAANKLRSQHRVRVEITTEQTSALASTRTLRNPNQERAVTFVIRKLYRRDRVVHERYGARLCLRLVVHDPVQKSLADFIDRAIALHPDRIVERAGMAIPPDAVSGEIGRLSSDGRTLEAYTEFTSARHVTRDLDARSAWSGVALDSHVLLSVGSPTVTEISVQFCDQWVGQEPTIKRTDTFRGAEARELYESLGGRVRWEIPPPINQQQPLGVFAIDFPRVFDHPAEGFVFEPFMFWTQTAQVSRVRWHASASWGASSDEVLAYEATTATLRAQAYADFDESGLIDLRDAATRVYPGQVVDKALRDLGTRLDNAYHLLDFDDAFVESVPWWSSPLGAEHVDSLRDTLRTFPMQLPADDFLVPALTAPRAEVYLPIHPGAEPRILGMVEDLYSTSLVRQIEEYREHFKRNNHGASLTYEEVAGPVPPLGTPAGSSDWLTSWEASPHRFDVLGAWSEEFPIDGVHTEMIQSATGAADEGAIAQSRPDGA